MIPIELRSRAGEIALAVNHVASLLPAGHPPADASTADGIRALGAETAAFQAWMTWRSCVRFRDVWQSWIAEQQPAQGERASTTTRTEDTRDV